MKKPPVCQSLTITGHVVGGVVSHHVITPINARILEAIPNVDPITKAALRAFLETGTIGEVKYGSALFTIQDVNA